MRCQWTNATQSTFYNSRFVLNLLKCSLMPSVLPSKIIYYCTMHKRNYNWYLEHVSWVHILREKRFSFIHFDVVEQWTATTSTCSSFASVIDNIRNSNIDGGWWLHYYYYYLFVRIMASLLPIGFDIPCMHPQKRRRKKLRFKWNKLEFHTLFSSVVLDCFFCFNCVFFLFY